MMVLCLLSVQLVLLFFLFFAVKKLYLTTLVVLESMVLTSLVLVVFILSISSSSLYIFIFLLVLAVCEAGLGLSVLMSYIKITGGNYIQSTFQL
uniref:NADH dehydrogenase subunit 4L n=1 Tax=Megalophaedusa bilabrata TaxID=1885860 RepID=A0A224AAH4_9EUPU|nr:NADH dehydrogenase subunit 4L [Megalophaedusa bilabrata]